MSIHSKMETSQQPPCAKINNRDYCAVPNCSSKAHPNSNIQFHQIPQQGKHRVNIINWFGNKECVDLCTEWQRVTKIKRITQRTKVCSLHFKSDDYIPQGVESKKKCLKKIAVPSCKLPNKSCSAMESESNRARLKRRLERDEKKMPAKKSKIVVRGSSYNQGHSNDAEYEKYLNGEGYARSGVEIVGPVGEVEFIGELPLGAEHIFEMCPFAETESAVVIRSEELVEESNVESGRENDVCEQMNSDIIVPELEVQSTKVNISVQVDRNELAHTSDASVQVKSSDSLFKFSSSLKTNAHLSTVTGIETFDILDTIVDLVKLATDNKFEKPHVRMKTRDRIIMTYMKIKMNQPYSFLAIMFNCYCERHCQRISLETIKVLSAVLKFAIRWPSQEEISRNQPLCFEGFEDTRIVLDCTEIFIQTPCSLCCQRIAYSHYKGACTCKFMTGVTAAGLITFVSQMYGGRASDNEIFNQSNLKNLLEKGDAIMVDKGFHIDEACQVNQWKLIRPPFKQSGKSQFTRDEPISTASIAAARVHVERFNQRIKVFQMLGSKFPIALVSSLPDIFTIVCATINLSSPILKDDKFMIVHGCLPQND